MKQSNTPPPEYPENAAYRRNSKALDFVQRQAMDHADQNRDITERAQKERIHSAATLLFAVGVGAFLDSTNVIWLLSFLALVGTGVSITWKAMAITHTEGWELPPAASDVAKGLAECRLPEIFIASLVGTQNDVNAVNEKVLAQKNSDYSRLLRRVRWHTVALVVFVAVTGGTLAFGENLCDRFENRDPMASTIVCGNGLMG